MSKSEIAENVMAFLATSADFYGRSAAEDFGADMFNRFHDLEMESPIEQLLYVAIFTVAKTNYLTIDNEPIEYRGKPEVGIGIQIIPQRKIGSYRVDFVIFDHMRNKPDVLWVVECDGHAFHDRNKEERAYEKRRDRYLTAHGYRLLHFTGSEIAQSPHAVAAEVLKAVTGDSEILTPEEYWATS